jgi:hypothetical protein
MHPWTSWRCGALVTAGLSALWGGCTPSLATNQALGTGGELTTSATGTGGSDFTFDAGTGTGPPPADAGGLCGNQIHQLITDPPNVYFVLDTSGSMATPVTGGTRYTKVQAAAASVVSHLHLLIKAGAARFPAPVKDQPCSAGQEIFPLSLNNATGFNSATKGLTPTGGTPTAATIISLLPKLHALPGKTIVVLATDGGPNCNSGAMCDITGCMENIEGCQPMDTCCAQGVNCCGPAGPAGPVNCVDKDPSVNAVAALAATGIRVAVIGVPGSQVYGDVLSAMALAGGAPLAAYPFYYKVDNLDTLIGVLGSIAGSAISCDFTLTDPPMDLSFTNVYLDQTIVDSDPVDGWTWSAAGVVTLHGASCAKLQSGEVGQVQIVSGCPTKVAQ